MNEEFTYHKEGIEAPNRYDVVNLMWEFRVTKAGVQIDALHGAIILPEDLPNLIKWLQATNKRYKAGIDEDSL
jgi:hypothetical protein